MTRYLDHQGSGRPAFEPLEPRVLLDGAADQHPANPLEPADVPPPAGAEDTIDPRQLGPSNRRSGLIISEIMYHPPDPYGESLEFIEITNTEAVFHDLSRYRLAGEINFIFPQGAVIPAQGRVVVAADPAAVAAYYGLSSVVGPFTGRLSNGGGTVSLLNQMDAILWEVEYSDAYPWPASADGAGPSLVLARPDYGEDDVQAWSASAYAYGSPGAADPTVGDLLSNVVINEVLVHTDLPQVDFIELYNYGTQSVSIAGCILSDNPDPAAGGYVIPAGTTIPADGYVSFTQTQLGFSLNMQGDDVYLRNPAGTRVLDAIVFGAQANGVSYGRYPDGSPEWRVLSARTSSAANAAPANGSVVINEIMYHPISEDSSDEYVELYNRGSTAVALDNWRFTQGIQYTFPAGTTIAAGGYLVVAADPARLIAAHPGVLNTTNTIGGFSGDLSDRGERIVLCRPDDPELPDQDFVVMDEVGYKDGESWGQWADGGGSSLELIDPDSDNMRAGNWAGSDETDKAPWTLVEYTGVLDLGQGTANEIQVLLFNQGEALLDDVQVFPVGQANRVANGTFESGLTGWVIQGTHIDSFLETTEGHTGSRSLHLVSTGKGDNSVNRVETDLTSALTVGTTATIRAYVRWLAGCPGILLRLHGNWLEAVGELIVPADLGTPGEPNSRHAANAAPSIESVAHSPVLPAAYQNVVVTARVADADGVGSVVVKWRNDTAAPATTYTVTMVDNGTGGDRIAGDGIYSGTIPGQAANQLVAFYVQAADSQAATSTFPTAAPVEECHVMFGQANPAGTFGTYRFWMTEAERLEWANRQKLSDDPIHGTFVYGNFRVIYNAGGRFRGSPFVRSAGDPETKDTSYVFYSNKDNRLLGSTSYNLDRLEGDDTKQRERMSLWLADQVDTPFFYERYVNLYVNERRKGTIYSDSQQPNDDMVEYWWPDGRGGDLYKIDDWFEFNDDSQVSREFNENGQLLLYVTTGGELKKARYRWSWGKEPLDGWDDDYGNFFEMVQAMNLDISSQAYGTVVSALVDYEEWMHTFAIQHIINNWDSYGYDRGKNMSTYKPLDGKWQMIMWDLDHAHMTGSPTTSNLFSINCPTARDKFFQYPEFRRAYWRAISETANGPMVAANVNPVLDANYAAFVANSISVTSPNVALKQWIADRRTWLLQQLQSVAAAFQITTNGGANYSTSQQVITLAGTAPVEVKTILINGNPAEVTWTSVTAWRIEIALHAGDNLLVVQGADSLGEIIGYDNITITYTNPGVSPVGKLVINEIMYHPNASSAEYIEIRNLSLTDAFDLAGWQIEGVGFTFGAGAVIRAGTYAVVAENISAFTSTYGATAAAAVIGVYGLDGALSNGGETLRLLMPAAGGLWTLIDEVTYDDSLPWPLAADGDGPSLQLIDATHDNDRIGNWAADTVTPYTPGASNSVAGSLVTMPDIRINEIQAHNVTAFIDNAGDHDPWVELYNAGTVNLDNCYLTDDFANLTKWAFPGGLTFTNGTYRVVWLDGETAEQTGGNLHANFAIDSLPGDLALVWKPGLTAYVVDYVSYDYAPADKSQGRYPNTEGELYLLGSATLGAANTPPYVGPVVISEVQYNPDGSDDLEFIELYNRSGAAINLWATYDSHDYGWELEGFQFAAGTVLAAGQSLVVVPFDPVLEPAELAAFEAYYGLTGLGVQIVGGYGANLDNNGEKLRLKRPDGLDPSQPLTALYADVDVVAFDDDPPWPAEADGDGPSLNRGSSTACGLEAASWQALEPTPGGYGVLADILDVSPDPRTTAVSQITIVFNEAVTGFDVGDLSLTRNGGADLLTGGEPLTTSNNITWTLGGLSGLTAADGHYVLTLAHVGAGIVDGAGNSLYRDATEAWLKDFTPPTANVVDVTPDPHDTPVEAIDIVFSEAVTGLDIADLTLTRNGSPNLLTGAEGLASADGITWTLSGLTALTDVIGAYTMVLTLTAAGSGIVDVAGNPLGSNASDTWQSAIPDLVPPTVGIPPVSPDPRTVPVASVQILFSEPVVGVSLGDLSLTRDGGGNLLTGAQSLSSGDGITYTLSGLTALTGSDGLYVLTLTASGSGITDTWGNPLTGGASISWRMDTQSPTADVVNVAPDPRSSPVDEIDIVFNEPVTGLDVADLILKRNAGANILTGSELLTTADGITWTLGGLTALTGTGGGSGGFVAYNDHVPGATTHPNATSYAANAEDSGHLFDIDTGLVTAVTLTVTASGASYATSQGLPAPGSDAYAIFDGFVDLGAANGASIEVNGSDFYTHTFSGLDTSGTITYSFHGTAIRGEDSYTDRWTLVTIEGADSFTIAHSAGDGIVYLSDTQVALWTGDNSMTDQGWVVGWVDIDPGLDGVFSVISSQYTGAVPTSIDAGGVADGGKGYALTGIRLMELGATGLEGWYELTLAAEGSGIHDAAGNLLAADASDGWVIGGEGPQVEILDVTPDPRNTPVSQVQIVFSEPVTGLDVGDLTLTRDGGADLLTGSEPLTTSDNVTWTLGGLSGLTGLQGAYTLSLTAAGSSIMDATSYLLLDDAVDTWTVDLTAPTADVANVSPDPRSTAVSQVQVVFSEPVTGLSCGNFTLTRDGGANLLTGGESVTPFDSLTWTLEGLAGLTGQDGLYVLTVQPTSTDVTDAAGNPLASVSSDSWTMDTTGPTADVLDVAPDPRNTPVSQVQIVFNEAVSGLSVGDFSLTRDGGANLLTGSEPLTTSDNVTWTLGGLAGLTAAGGTYVLALTGSGSGVQDALGNPMASNASDTWYVDFTPPTADITNVAPDPRNTSVSQVQIVFNEPVSGLSIGDLSLTRNGGANLLTGSEPITTSDYITWTLGGLSALTGQQGSYVLTLTAAGAGIQDAFGNTMTANASDFWQVDTTAPAADVVNVSPDPRNTAVSQVLIVFSEAVTGLDIGDLSLTRSGGANLLTAGQTITTSDYVTWTLGNLTLLTGPSGSYVVTLTAGGAGIHDTAGNFLTASASDTWVTDSTAPTADVVDVAPDPRTTSVSQVQIVFNEAISGLDIGDLSLTRNGGANLLTGSEPLTTSDNITWTLGSLSSLTAAEGTYVLALTAAGAGVQDALGNLMAANASDTWVVDLAGPTVDILDVSPDPRTTAVSQVQIVFNEPVSGLSVEDLTLTRDGGGNLLTGAEPLTTSDSVTWTLGGLAGLTADSGAYVLTLTAAGAGIYDAAGNALTAGASDSWTADTVVPTADIIDVSPDPRNTSVTQALIVFSEPVSGLSVSDFFLSRNGGPNRLTGSEPLTTSDYITWTLGGLSILTSSSGSYVLTLTAAGSGIADACGNALVANVSDAWVLDSSAPTVNIVDVTPDPRSTPVSQVQITFNEAVTGLDVADFTLTCDGGANLLTTAQTVTTTNNITWTLGGLAGVTAINGSYLLTLTAAGAGIHDLAGNSLTANATDSWLMDGPADVLGQYVFYNGSKFDNPAKGFDDDDAIAPDKSALMPGGTATFNNYTSYSLGINGIMIDVINLADDELTAADFSFKKGNSNTPSSWVAAAAPISVVVRPGQGEGGSDRVTLIWADNAIQKTWLEVTVLDTAQTGLDEPYVFYFGNAIGESGDNPANAYVDSGDRLGARANPRGVFNPAPIDFKWDYNRDGLVDSGDRLIARANATSAFTALKLIVVPDQEGQSEASAPAPTSAEALAPAPERTAISAPAAGTEPPADLLATQPAELSLPGDPQAASTPTEGSPYAQADGEVAWPALAGSAGASPLVESPILDVLGLVNPRAEI